jgi:hypothetical protein
MQKPLALSIAACLGLAGCNVFQKSETWNQAVRVRPAETARDPDPSNAYAAKLHAALAGRGVEHKVVVYQYRYTTRLREEAVGTRTAVIYRDDTNRRYPWWLKDDRLNNPFWLPNGNLDNQVSFYVRRKAEVIETKDYPPQGGSGKTIVAFAKPAPALRLAANPHPAVAAARITPVKKAPALAVTKKAAPSAVVVQSPPPVKTPVIVKTSAPKKPAVEESIDKSSVAKIKLPSTFFAAQRAPETESAAAIPTPSRNTGNAVSWSPPNALDTTEQNILTAPRDEHFEKLFRAKHGTDYNRFSATDRRKLQQLQHNVASRE